MNSRGFFDMAVLQDAQQEYLGTREAGDLTGYHPTHFNSIILQGKLPATKDERGRWRIKKSDLEKYLASNAVKPRRDPKFTAKEEKAITSAAENVDLASQVTQQEKQIKHLSHELDTSKVIISDLKDVHAVELANSRRETAQTEEKLNRAKTRIERLKEENHELRLENNEHVNFLRTTIKDLLVYVTK